MHMLSQVVKSSFACLTWRTQFGPKGKWTSVKIHHFHPFFKYSTVLFSTSFCSTSQQMQGFPEHTCVCSTDFWEKRNAMTMCKMNLIMILKEALQSIIHQNWFKCVPTKRVVQFLLRPLFPPTNKSRGKWKNLRFSCFYTLFTEMIISCCQQFPAANFLISSTGCNLTPFTQQF